MLYFEQNITCSSRLGLTYQVDPSSSFHPLINRQDTAVFSDLLTSYSVFVSPTIFLIAFVPSPTSFFLCFCSCFQCISHNQTYGYFIIKYAAYQQVPGLMEDMYCLLMFVTCCFHLFLSSVSCFSSRYFLVPQIFKELCSSSSYSFHFRHLSLNDIMKEVISSQNMKIQLAFLRRTLFIL